MNKIQIVFETTLSPDDLHELLCKSIHEQDPVSLQQLTDTTEDIIHPYLQTPK